MTKEEEQRHYENHGGWVPTKLVAGMIIMRDYEPWKIMAVEPYEVFMRRLTPQETAEWQANSVKA